MDNYETLEKHMQDIPPVNKDLRRALLAVQKEDEDGFEAYKAAALRSETKWWGEIGGDESRAFSSSKV